MPPPGAAMKEMATAIDGVDWPPDLERDSFRKAPAFQIVF